MNFALPAEIDTQKLSEEGVTFPVLSLTSGLPLFLNDKPLTITVKGADSKAYQTARMEVQRKQLKANGAVDPVVVQCELLAAVTIAWSGFVDAQGREAQCTPENAAKLYVDAPAIRDQIDGRVHNRSNFTRASSMN